MCDVQLIPHLAMSLKICMINSAVAAQTCQIHSLMVFGSCIIFRAQSAEKSAPSLSPHSFLKYATNAASLAQRWQKASSCSFAKRRASALLTSGLVNRMICSRSAKMGSTLALTFTCNHSASLFQYFATGKGSRQVHHPDTI